MRSVIIAGCGRLGSHIAEYYSQKNLNVVVLDNDESAFELLASDYTGFTITGSAAEYGILKKAGVESADLFVAVTKSDTLNIMCAELALRHFNVPQVLARVYEPSLEEFCRSLGIPAVSPVMATADRFLNEISMARREQDGKDIEYEDIDSRRRGGSLLHNQVAL